MNYELAKALKEAGFSQRKSLLCYEDDSDAVYLITRAEADKEGKEWSESCPDAPTLLELTESCDKTEGWHMFTLTHPLMGWVAHMEKEVGEPLEEIIISGDYRKTPEEAVANLWLELNKTL